MQFPAVEIANNTTWYYELKVSGVSGLKWISSFVLSQTTPTLNVSLEIPLQSQSLMHVVVYFLAYNA